MLGFGFGEWLVILSLVLILFGAERLPKLARTLGRAFRSFQREIKDVQEAVVSSSQREREGEAPTALLLEGATRSPIIEKKDLNP